MEENINEGKKEMEREREREGGHYYTTLIQITCSVNSCTILLLNDPPPPPLIEFLSSLLFTEYADTGGVSAVSLNPKIKKKLLLANTLDRTENDYI